MVFLPCESGMFVYVVWRVARGLCVFVLVFAKILYACVSVMYVCVHVYVCQSVSVYVCSVHSYIFISISGLLPSRM